MNASTALRHAHSRIRSTRGSCFLTRGSDNYDHHGLKKARRAASRAEIAVQLEEVAETVRLNELDEIEREYAALDWEPIEFTYDFADEAYFLDLDCFEE